MGLLAKINRLYKLLFYSIYQAYDNNFVAHQEASPRVLYMSFDKFILAVESRDLSQADKSIIRVSSFPKLSDG